MKSIILIFTMLMLLSSCKQEDTEIYGTYQGVDYNWLEQVWMHLNNSWYTIGNDLAIKEDSTFTYSNCSTIMTGTWSVEVDTLLLDVATARWKIDSLQRLGFKGRWPSVPEKPYKYHFQGDQLLRKETFFHKGKDQTVVYQMKKVKLPR